MIIKICVGSSCHLKGSEEIVALFQKAVAQYHLENQVTLAGSFCMGACTHDGVSVQVDDAEPTSVTVQDFDAFWRANVLDQCLA